LAAPALDALAERFPKVRFAFVYTREAHPGEKCPAHRRLEDKLRCARRMVDRLGITRQMLVDDLTGAVHRAYGSLPNMAWVVERRGRVFYRASWTDERSIEWALQQLEHQDDARRSRHRLLPYYMEVAPSKIADRAPFAEGLVGGGGSRALDEFIAALEEVHGPAAAAELKRWRKRSVASP
jgi:hypothetical protein